MAAGRGTASRRRRSQSRTPWSRASLPAAALNQAGVLHRRQGDFAKGRGASAAWSVIIRSPRDEQAVAPRETIVVPEVDRIVVGMMDFDRRQAVVDQTRNDVVDVLLAGMGQRRQPAGARDQCHNLARRCALTRADSRAPLSEEA